MRHVTIAVISDSQLIRLGICGVLNGIREYSININEYATYNEFRQTDEIRASLLIIDPLFMSSEFIAETKELSDGRCRIAALSHSMLPVDISRDYDAVISIYDKIEVIQNAILQLLQSEDTDDDTKVLSQREKEVVKYIVKGLSNKEIAADMNVSVNTVMTHRRNITSKLQIHSPAGLTIYAIVSKLVSLDEISSYHQQ